MSIALFVPCYVDQLRPRVGLAALDLLRAAGCDVTVLEGPRCCGQPFLTAGERATADEFGQRFAEATAGFDTVVTPSGSCTATLGVHLLPSSPQAKPRPARVIELTAFLAERDALPACSTPFPHRVGLHASCHALRELRQGRPSEVRAPGEPEPDPAATLLADIPELSLVDLTRRDECCGFGGVFSIEEEAVSVRMGRDRLADHQKHGTEVLASTDVSCLLHLEGLARRNGPPLRVLHVAEILAESMLGAGWLDRNAQGGSDGAR